MVYSAPPLKSCSLEEYNSVVRGRHSCSTTAGVSVDKRPLQPNLEFGTVTGLVDRVVSMHAMALTAMALTAMLDTVRLL